MWDYLSEKGKSGPIGRYCLFWDIDLIEKSSDEQVGELLDHLQQRLPSLRLALDVRDLNDLLLKLLVRGLKAHGEELETKRLYDWLNANAVRRE